MPAVTSLRGALSAAAVTVLSTLLATGVLHGRSQAAPALAVKASTAAVSSARTLSVHTRLMSPNHRFTAGITASGSLIVTDRGRPIFSTRTKGSKASLQAQQDGNLVLSSGRKVLWNSGTKGSGRANLIRLGNDGNLTLQSAAGAAWSSLFGNHCLTNTANQWVIVSLSRQHAWMCHGRTQLLSSPVTTGASARGDGTPTGTWLIQSKQRERYLYPSDGSRYFVHYWMPYNGDFGFHDSSWQRFAYGSGKYQVLGSHGCVHLPLPAMGWFYQWAAVGAKVTVLS